MIEHKRKFLVYANYGYEDEICFTGPTTLEEAKEIFNQEKGHHRILEIAWFAADGEYIIEQQQTSRD